jgi:hypothetical protein
MNIDEALRRIQFKVGTWEDISGRSINPIIKNRYIIDELNSQLRQYSNITKGIQDTFTFPLNVNTPYVLAPSLALRSRAYIHAHIIINATIFPMDIRPAQEVYNVFKVQPIQGITNWIMPFSMGKTQYLGLYPNNPSAAQTTTLTADITPLTTTIPVTSTAGFISRFGRLTIGDEKIMYTYTDATNFYGCTREIEQTTAVDHTNTTTVSQNNVVIFYSRLPVNITVNDDNIVPHDVLSRDLEVVEEHMEGIIKAVAYNILIKLSPDRAIQYKIDTDELYNQYAGDIKKGFGRNRMGSNVRDQFPTESGLAYGSNLLY